MSKKKKNKRGRPRTTKEYVMIPLRLEQDTVQALDKLAEADDRSRASFLRRLIQGFIKENPDASQQVHVG